MNNFKNIMHFISTFAAVVVRNMSHWGIYLRDLIHFGAHFHIILRKSMTLNDVNHCTLIIRFLSIFSNISDSLLSENDNSN